MILNTSVLPSEGEVSVKSYLCTSFNSWFLGIKADGYLEVTSKRLLFQAAGTGATKSTSVIHSEVPISEIAGINVFVGKAFNLLRAIVGVIIMQFVIAIMAGVVTFALSFLDNSPVIYQFVIWLLFFACLYFAYSSNNTEDASKDNSFKELLLTSVGLGLLATLAKGAFGSFSNSFSGYGMHSFGSAPIALIVFPLTWLYGIYRYARKPAFSLQIHSKAGTSSIVNITGPSPMGKADSLAAKALTAKPGRDSQLVLKELGAVILDIQSMGEYGVDKWKKN